MLFVLHTHPERLRLEMELYELLDAHKLLLYIIHLVPQLV